MFARGGGTVAQFADRHKRLQQGGVAPPGAGVAVGQDDALSVGPQRKTAVRPALGVGGAPAARRVAQHDHVFAAGQLLQFRLDARPAAYAFAHWVPFWPSSPTEPPDTTVKTLRLKTNVTLLQFYCTIVDR